MTQSTRPEAGADRSETKPTKPHAPAVLRNRDAILAVLSEHLPERGTILEIASGTGEHAAYLTPRLHEGLVWQPSDADPAALPGIDAHSADSLCARIRPAIHIDATAPDWHMDPAPDAIFCANMIHIAPWAAGQGLIAGAGRLLAPGGLLILYGPFRRDGAHTAESNAAFDESLQARDPSWGVRDLEGEVLPEATEAGFVPLAVEEMPANNLTVILRKEGRGT